MNPLKWLLEFVYGSSDTDWRGWPKTFHCMTCNVDVPVQKRAGTINEHTCYRNPPKE